MAAPTGTGSGSVDALGISGDAIQWRIQASCDGSDVQVRVAGGDEAVLGGPCGEEAVGYTTETGTATLEVETDGAWQLQIDQQIDTPLSEPPTPAMTAPEASVVASGDFYDIDNTGTGTVDLYQLGDGSYALRLEDFFVTPNVDLEIRLSVLEEPQTSEEFLQAPNEFVRLMDVTAGSLNYPIPASTPPSSPRWWSGVSPSTAPTPPPAWWSDRDQRPRARHRAAAPTPLMKAKVRTGT